MYGMVLLRLYTAKRVVKLRCHKSQNEVIRTEAPGLLLVSSVLQEESTRAVEYKIALNRGCTLELRAWSWREHMEYVQWTETYRVRS